MSIYGAMIQNIYINYKNPKMVEVRILSVKARFVEIFLVCSKKLRADNKHLKQLLWHISRLAQKATKECRPIRKTLKETSQRVVNQRAPTNLDGLISNAQPKVDAMKPQLQEVYAAISSSTIPNISFSSTAESFSVMKSMDDLLKNILEVHVCAKHSRPVAPLKKIIGDLNQILEFLREFLGLTKNWCSDHKKLKDLHVYTLAVIESVSCLFYLCLHDMNNIDEEMVVKLILEVKRAMPTHPEAKEIYINALKASKSSGQSKGASLIGEPFVEFLDSLLDDFKGLKPSSLTSVKIDKEYLHWMLKILKNYFVDPALENWDIDIHLMLNNLFLRIKNAVCEAACAVYSCHGSHWTEDLVRKLKLSTSELVQDCKHIQREATDLYERIVPASMKSDFPTTNKLGFIDFVLQKLNRLQINNLNYQINEVKLFISSLRSKFFENAEQPGEDEDLKDYWRRFIDAVYQTEYVVDLISLGTQYLWYDKLGLVVLIFEIRDILIDIGQMKDRSKDELYIRDTDDVTSQSSSSLQPTNVAGLPSDYMELFEDEAEQITEQLLRGSKQLQIVSIVGMPGIGKTTLANAIYENRSVQLHFHVCARCSVSQAYQKKRVLVETLQQISGRNDQVHGSDYDLAKKLYQSLKGKRYLILIDDLWDKWQWNDMKASFPDDGNRSRILFTSRFHNMALQIGSKGITFPLHQLSDAKSWELLQAKLFERESCPGEILRVGMQIATKCRGLPLSLNLVAGFLRNIERKEERWEQVEKSLSKQLLEDQQGGCVDVLELSYNHLPDHLKPCFLYFGAFPEEKEVSTSKLVSLWIAEGFVQLREDVNETLEDAAENILNDLIARSLVIVSKRRSDGRIKTTRLHDLLHEFALGKAKEEFFLQDSPLSSRRSEVHVPYRLKARSRWDNLAALSKPHHLRIRSLILSCYLPSNQLNDASNFLRNLRLLKILDLGNIELQDFPELICSFCHLTFLSLRYYSNEIPRNINKLRNLETLMVKVTSSSRGLQMSETYWYSERLRHLKVNPFCVLPTKENFLNFINLQTLSTSSLSYGDHTGERWRGFPNLRKLSCIFSNMFPALDFPSQLESLKVEYRCQDRVQLPWNFKFPDILRKLSLRDFQLPWSELSTVGKLPNLQVLKLLQGSFEGDTWDMNEGEFLKLQYLKLQSLDVEHWNVYEDHLPCLETLVVDGCDKLEIPDSLGDIPTLQKIELIYCNPSARIASKIIQEKQVEMGNERFVLAIKEKALEDP